MQLTTWRLIKWFNLAIISKRFSPHMKHRFTGFLNCSAETLSIFHSANLVISTVCHAPLSERFQFYTYNCWCVQNTEATQSILVILFKNLADDILVMIITRSKYQICQKFSLAIKVNMTDPSVLIHCEHP